MRMHYVPKDEDGDGLIDTLIEPDQMRGIAQVKSDRPCEGTDPFLCFMEAGGLSVLRGPGSWFGPDFLLRGKEDEDLTDPSEFPFVVRFLGLLNVTEGLPPRIDPNQLDAPLGFVALNLYRFEDVLQEVTPEGGSSYIFFLDGSILAGTGWDHMSVSYGMYESSLQYEKIWQLNTEWSPELTEEDIRSGERLEFYTSNQDLVVIEVIAKGIGASPAPSMAKSTVFWSPGEASLSRDSLNTLLQPGDKLDVTEAMMKAATIGRAAEMGDGWEPPGMISRKIATLLSSRSPGSQGPAASLGAFAALLAG
ncbi:hypothetical protein AK812_SmicGene3662 [Symbiodinium microadriaticum]|uniref:Uncharacterized protein n=1 Tax=Symbiodinium microadriaticum TaxID=2951 RepID=A0A1Q9EYD4_SYMMI|nr:hypothetical protein AK812_SmicGene3662 [Symbiodinium microadriaticum]